MTDEPAIRPTPNFEILGPISRSMGRQDGLDSARDSPARTSCRRKESPIDSLGQAAGTEYARMSEDKRDPEQKTYRPGEKPSADKSTGYRASWRNIRVRRLLIVAVATYVGVCVLITALQTRLIYFPSREYEAYPPDVGLAFDDLTLHTSDGVNIAAWYIPHDRPMGSVIFFHGNAGNMADRLHSIKVLHDMGLNILIIDYRGYGRSEGKPSETGTYEDAEAAWRYLTETKGEAPNRVVLFGRSLGGAIAIELATRHQAAALVVESTFTSLRDIGRLHYRFLPVGLILTYRYESLAKVPRITCPKLFFHGRDDTLIPLENGRRLFEAAAEPKEFVETPGEHNEGGFTYSPEFGRRLEEFLHGVLAGE